MRQASSDWKRRQHGTIESATWLQVACGTEGTSHLFLMAKVACHLVLHIWKEEAMVSFMKGSAAYLHYVWMAGFLQLDEEVQENDRLVFIAVVVNLEITSWTIKMAAMRTAQSYLLIGGFLFAIHGSWLANWAAGFCSGWTPAFRSRFTLLRELKDACLCKEAKGM